MLSSCSDANLPEASVLENEDLKCLSVERASQLHWPNFTGLPVAPPVAGSVLQFDAALLNVSLMNTSTSVCHGGHSTLTYIFWDESWRHRLGKSKEKLIAMLP